MDIEQEKDHRGSSRVKDHRLDWIISQLLTLWACYIRLYKISEPDSVVFDEVHFGGFASKYINKKFFMDVHPPLAKLLITWIAQWAGFDGSFDFKKIGKSYIDDEVPYIPIRIFCALHGIMLVPIAYWSLRSARLSIPTAVLTSFMICYENGLITNNRLILLDPILLFFTALTLLSWVNFHNQSHRPFGKQWHLWLTLTGISLGMTISCKWVGLFLVATIGIFVLKELWMIWGDQHTDLGVFWRHFSVRFMCLIIIPCYIYLTCFKIHLNILTDSGTGTHAMSPSFQSSLNGIRFPMSTPIDIIYGTKVDLRHLGTRGGYLHSHEHDYPGGSNGQQVTLYPHKDKNNWWLINKAANDTVDGIEYVRHGDVVRLTHITTHRRLHTHDIRPITNDETYQYEVSGYGFEGFEGDANDNWIIEIQEDNMDDMDQDIRLLARRSTFRLISVTQACALFSRKHKLPDWGFKQQEVTCMKDGVLSRSLWTIETTQSELLTADTDMVTYPEKTFMEKFVELHKVMWEVNQGLPSTHPYGSRPMDWPLLHRGISFWTQKDRKIYLLGNPLVYLLSTVSVVSYMAFQLLIMVKEKRKIGLNEIEVKKYDEYSSLFCVGWALHYFPFYLMKRQLFLHHYLPSLYMAILLAGVLFEMITHRLPTKKKWYLVILIILITVCVYHIFSPLTYGEQWSKKQCNQATWRNSWDFKCPK
ncbi:protein O-D-mannosyltransferase [Pilobolus umbonatus]|nr:protein O-D-mannosyltransferase [Pilobolus umbonatus]